jgi:hypothetical protein
MTALEERSKSETVAPHHADVTRSSNKGGQIGLKYERERKASRNAESQETAEKTQQTAEADSRSRQQAAGSR